MPNTRRAIKALKLTGRWIWLIGSRALLVYCVVFTIVCSVVLYRLTQRVSRPIKAVQRLATENPGETAFMARTREQLREAGEPDTLVHTFVPLDSVSPVLVRAVIAAEDDAFYSHPGVDIVAVLSAAEYNKQRRRSGHGASTITQQVAKNLFLSEERTYRRKIEEACYSALLEWLLGKERILELYLNYAQWGRNVYGCEAAAQVYFGKSCSNLGLNESARLAAVLAMPTRLSPWATRSSFMHKRLAVIATNLYFRKFITDSAFTALTGTQPPRKESDSTATNGAAASSRPMAEDNTDTH